MDLQQQNVDSHKTKLLLPYKKFKQHETSHFVMFKTLILFYIRDPLVIA